MKEYITTRDAYILGTNIVLAPDLLLSKDKVVAIFKRIRSSGSSAEDSIDFLTRSFDEIELAINNLLSGLENRVDYLTTSVSHISRVKASKSATSTKFDAKTVNLTSGRYVNMTYSSTDKGLILATRNKTLLVVEKSL